MAKKEEGMNHQIGGKSCQLQEVWPSSMGSSYLPTTCLAAFCHHWSGGLLPLPEDLVAGSSEVPSEKVKLPVSIY